MARVPYFDMTQAPESYQALMKARQNLSDQNQIDSEIAQVIKGYENALRSIRVPEEQIKAKVQTLRAGKDPGS